MTLTLGSGPLASAGPDDTNYEVVGPKHRLLFADFPRRVRAVLGDATVLDTTRGRLLHESNLLPVLYVPEQDVDQSLLQRTEHSTHCPFKGDAAYWSVVADSRTADNAVWGYPEPHADAQWLRGYQAVYFESMDGWLDEDEQVQGHLRDPYHRVDARRSSRTVRVTAGTGAQATTLAQSSRPVVVSETGLPNRFYLPAQDVRTALLERWPTTTHCPYKGTSTYWSLADGSGDDVAWSYAEPYPDVAVAAGMLCFLADGVTTEVTP